MTDEAAESDSGVPWADYDCLAEATVDDEEADSIMVPGVGAGSSDRVHAGQGSVSLTETVETDGSGDCDSDGMEVTFLNVGKGTSILVEAPNGENMLIDAGTDDSPEEWTNTPYRTEMVEAVDDQGINEIDHLVVTHGDRDHEKYIPDIVNNFDVKNGYYSEHGGSEAGTDPREEKDEYIDDGLVANEWQAVTADNGALEGTLGDVDVDVFNPPSDERTCGRHKDCNSIGLTISYQPDSSSETHTFLIPSDIRYGLVGDIASGSNSPYQNADVYLLPHHGVDSAVNTMVLCKLVGRDTSDEVCHRQTEVDPGTSISMERSTVS
ncbi:ComEC/Rec2 family competence protein [Halovenus rubra]|uniref:ComEC/Rec2 family competence protein n=2 Tax=Halovenus rubra TaxID=869890 RepID=A0ACC7DZ67_9EURY|nr:MBL fold metallo-hydrolase [Halovenus rubra]